MGRSSSQSRAMTIPQAMTVSWRCSTAVFDGDSAPRGEGDGVSSRIRSRDFSNVALSTARRTGSLAVTVANNLPSG
jgi:hypothetical protein